jgi:hypothetical protein
MVQKLTFNMRLQSSDNPSNQFHPLPVYDCRSWLVRRHKQQVFKLKSSLIYGIVGHTFFHLSHIHDIFLTYKLDGLLAMLSVLKLYSYCKT